jgi:UDP-glucose 6-dehydrogenase
MRFNPGPGLGGHCILGSEWLRIRGCGLAGVYRAADLFGVIARRFPAAVTRNGIFVEPKGLEALALDTGSGEVDWFPVTTLYRGRYEGRGVRFSIDAANDLTVTNEHPMLVHRDHVFETVSAQNVNAGDRLPVVQEDQSSGMVDRTAQVAKAETVQISDWVYSMEVPEANTFVTSSGIAVHNCIPLDPFYLAWRAREAGVPTRFIELAGEINTSMPGYVIEKLQAALNERGKAVKGAKVLILGLAYKPDIDDPRESPAFEIIDRLLALGAEISYHDPHIPIAPKMRSWPGLPRMTSVELTPEALAAADAVLLVTNHEKVDYDLVLEHAPLIIDTRGVYRGRGGMVRPA